MKVNGKYVELVAPMTVTDLILNTGYKQDRVAVELNGKIVPRSKYSATFLEKSDSVEIVGFVGGG
ncbi:sulfur carrier protein ThiS [Candidatus Methanoplasma termitum]|uniref:Sulfur carrier protein ThiS n=1 Tax=Candidatus Methanoplasma termitum TaxID=1577791 RepID=A0A0A7LB32_9ARCH|nr:sulfur carrier protein ThiS [Candidatus Methanoplasma termitum]AIZ56208.1 sulfur carrier protein ThiS [Candidatus Methanoplasma termitum]MCL2334404.1 sulfur carrier protein ThiS [Candidatus Methanoplasma sp.]